MKYVKLLTAAHVGGVLRHPHEGALHVSDADAKRLLDNEAAIDVTDDFPKGDDAPVEKLSTQSGARSATPEPHQSEVDPAAEQPKTGRKSASKE